MNDRVSRRPLRIVWPSNCLRFGLQLVFLASFPFCFSSLRAAPLPELKTDSSPLVAEAQPAFSFKTVVRKVTPSVVNIYTTKNNRVDRGMTPLLDDPMLRQFFGTPFENLPRGRREQALGSGVIVSQDGYILTNNHVVDGADEIKVALHDGETTFDAKLVGSDPQTDIAVIKVAAQELPAITLTDSDKVEVGDVVLAVGNPVGVGQTVTMGIVSGKGRAGIGMVDYEDFIQTDASINPGNSGGPLVDVAGRLIGINQSIISGSGGNLGVGFSVPANLARYVMEHLITDGKVIRGYLGIMIQPLSPELVKAFMLPDKTGALVGEVTKNSPAAVAGMREGDVVVEFNGTKVNDSSHLRLIVSQTSPGTTVAVRIVRDGKKQELKVMLSELPSQGLPKAGLLGGGNSGDVLDGVAIDDLDPGIRRLFNIPNTLEGALVTEVATDSLAARAGLSPGDVILEINRQRVSTADEAVQFSRELEDGHVLLRVWSNGASRYLAIGRP